MKKVQPIITVPHNTLRRQAQPISIWNEETAQFIDNLTETLHQKDNPRGVGLAAPQIDRSLRIFCTLLSPEGARPDQENPPQMRVFINPEIVNNSAHKTLGEDPHEPTLEGCLSIPFLYGPVPRWEWIELEFQTPEQGKLITKREKFSEFAARVVQHEYDHLNGILFTDYILQYDLPLYEDVDGKLKKINNSVAKKF